MLFCVVLLFDLAQSALQPLGKLLFVLCRGQQRVPVH